MKLHTFLTVASVLLSAAITTSAHAQDQQAPSDNRMPGDMMSQSMMGCPGMGSQDMMGMRSHMMRMMSRGSGAGRWGHHRGFGLRMMVILMDTDGDGALSLEEVQSAHARIFKAVDANKDGKVTVEEMQQFFRGSEAPDKADKE
ncbi:MAG: EF-hand domain-containing protein [Hyphomicrobiales bacterium]